MKTIYKIFIAALPFILSLASCTREMDEVGGNVEPAVDEEMRVFTVSFAASVKSEPGTGDDWQHPVFSEHDVIKVSNDTQSQDCEVFLDNGEAKIKTNLSGALIAVYPSTAAVLSSGTGGYITGFKVPASQDGSYAAANICMAEGVARYNSNIVFTNKTALFKVTPPSGVTQFTVTSLCPVDSGVRRTGTAVPINTEGATDSDKLVVTVGDGSASLGTVYVSLLPGVRLSDLSFDATRVTSGNRSMKGLPESSIKARATSTGKSFDAVNVTAAGKAYTVRNEGWHPYVELGGTKWATMNLGATAETGTGSYGDYFMWGEIKGHKADLSLPVISETGFKYIENAFMDNFNGFDHSDARYTGTWNASSCFDFCNAPYSDNTAYFTSGKYNENGGKTILDLSDDAAYAGWGGAWRIPSSEELESLLAFYINYSSSVFTFQDGDNIISLPDAGAGVETYLQQSGSAGAYLSSTLFSNNAMNFLALEETRQEIYFQVRYYGFPIRPVADEVTFDVEGSLSDYDGSGLNALPKGALPGQFTVNASGGKVFFSKGNLYWDGDSYEFEANQYDYRHYNGINGDRAVLNGLTTFTPNGTVGSFYFVKKTETNNKPYDLTYGTPSPADAYGDVLFTNNDITTPNPDFAVFGEKGCYRALNLQELQYLISTRGGNMFAYARYKDVPGMLIFPDGYTLPSGYDSDGGQGVSKINYHDESSGTLFPAEGNNISEDVWAGMQSAGVVFLPASGYRSDALVEDGNITTSWLSRAGSNSEGYCIWNGRTGQYYNRNKGLTIRLVTDVK